MTFSRPPSRLNPKVSTMPRQKTEASQYLNAYKLSIEKKRLQQEFESLGKRRDRIQDRLAVIEQQLQTLEDETQQYSEPGVVMSSLASEPNSVIYPPAHHRNSDAEVFKTVTLDY
jgi:predicted  nucleic acid-binding Zn-ribbon protein